jgi:hypothetical protein
MAGASRTPARSQLARRDASVSCGLNANKREQNAHKRS